jgi:aspartate racemase
MEPDNALYNVPRAYHLKGKLDLPAFERALNGLIARHEILRTTYGVLDDEPVQIIAPEQRCELRVEDLSCVSDLLEVKEREAVRRAQEEADRPFCLAADSMLRVLLLRLDREHHLLVLNTHHIASDGWSGGILLRELATLYEAALGDETTPLPELPIQYSDYAVWQRAWLEGQVLEKQLAYWKAKLAGASPFLALPTDKPRNSVVGHRGAVQQLELPGTLLDAVRSLSSQEGTTPFMTLLAAFQSVLLYVTGQTDLVVGTDVANRPSVQTENLIGFFVNLLVLRTDLSGNPTFQGLLRRVRAVALGAYAHQDVVFDKLVGELQPERSLTHNPLVQVLFVEQNTPRSQTSLRGVTMTPHSLDVASKFDMALFVRQIDSGIDCRCLFNPDLFTAGTIARMMALYEAAIEVGTSHSDVSLSGLMQCLERVDGQYRAIEHAGYEELSVERLRRVKRKAVQTL